MIISSFGEIEDGASLGVIFFIRDAVVGDTDDAEERGDITRESKSWGELEDREWIEEMLERKRDEN